MYSNSKEKKSTSENESIVELRNKRSHSLKVDIHKKSEKYSSGGGTPELLFKLGILPKQFDIESMGTAIHGTQAKVDYARIRTKSQHSIDIVRKKEKNAGYSSLNNEVKKSQSIKNHADYEKIKIHLSLPFHSEYRNSGMEVYSRLKKNGDLESHRHFIKNNPSEATTYLFHQMRNIVETLKFLHRGVFLDENGNTLKGIIHGDIKPDNILMDENGNLSLADFGCAHYADEPIEQLGAATYLSPELLKIFVSKISDNSEPGKSDIWSLGLTLQSILTGKCPIEEPYSQIEIDSINSMSKDINGYIIREIKPTLVDQEIFIDKLANLKLDNPEIEQEPIQIQQIRKVKVNEYLQPKTCKNNLKSKKIIKDLCQNLSHDNMENMNKSHIFHHLTSSMLLPSEQRPTAEELSETMEKLVSYFPYDHEFRS